MSWREVLKADIDLSQYPDYDGTPKRKLSSFEQEMVEQNKKGLDRSFDGDYKVRSCENCGVIQHRGRPPMFIVRFTNIEGGRDNSAGEFIYCDVCLEGVPKIDSDGNKIESTMRLRRNEKLDEESNRLIQDMRGN